MVVRGSACEAAFWTSRSGTPRVERGSDERVAEAVRPYPLGDPGAASDPADDPGGTVAVEPPPADGHEQRAVGSFADGQTARSAS